MKIGGSKPPDSGLRIAYVWVSRIITVSLEMVLPGLAGMWLDATLRWSPALTVLGFAIGLVLGVWHLLAMVRPDERD